MNELVLAIDVSTDLGSIALLRGDELLEQVELHSAEGFAHVLFGEIEWLLARNSVRLSDIDLYASASGPGSFTGVRVGLTAVKGLADATNRKVVAVSNLQAMASFGSAPLRAVILDARRGEVYTALYNRQLEVVGQEVVTKLEPWLAGLPDGADEFITSLPLPERPGARFIRPPAALADAIGLLALDQFHRGAAKDPDEIDANYVRRSDAELFWKDLAGL